MTAWIDMIADDDASTELKDVLDHARTPHGTGWAMLCGSIR